MLAKLNSVALAVTCLFRGKWASAFDVTLREGEEPYTMLMVPSYVSCLPWRRSSEGVEVLLLRVFRQAAGTVWEPCEGIVKSGETAITAIARELSEECGLEYFGSQWIQLAFIGYIYKATDRCIESEPLEGQELAPTRAKLYLLELDRDTELGEQSLDLEEKIEPHWIPLQEASDLVREEARAHGTNAALLILLGELERKLST